MHGSAPDIAGKGTANPYSMILSFKMLLKWLGSRKNDLRILEAAKGLEETIVKALKNAIKTPDLGGNLSTEEVR